MTNGAVLAAKSVLTGITVPYGIYAGVPARLVRLRFDPETIESLVGMAWWDWPIENIRKAIPILQSPLSPTSIEQLRTVGPNL